MLTTHRRLPPLDPPLAVPRDARRPHTVWLRRLCVGPLARCYAERWRPACECGSWADAEIAARGLGVPRASVCVLPFWLKPVQER